MRRVRVRGRERVRGRDETGRQREKRERGESVYRVHTILMGSNTFAMLLIRRS